MLKILLTFRSDEMALPKTTNMPPRVSVILTTYNGESRGFISEAIDSVLKQTMNDFELIIVDDGSTDRTADIYQKFTTDSRVKIVKQRNKGLAAARNAGIAESRSDLICFLDDDDFWRDDKLEKQYQFMLENPLVGLLSSKLALIDENGAFLRYRFHAPRGHIYHKQLLENQIDAPSSVMVRKSVLEKVGFFREHLYSCEDYDLWLRITREHLVDCIDEPLVFYRVHQNSMSMNFRKMEFYRIYVLYLSLSNDSSLKDADVYSNAFNQMFWGHVYRQDFREASRCFWQSFSYKWPGLKMVFAYFMIKMPKINKLMPVVINIMKTIKALKAKFNS